MTPLREWLKPPRKLLLILFLLTLVSVSALGWFGWRLLDQERIVESQRAQERLEQAADQVSATLRGALAETGERLGVWLSSPPAGSEPADGLLLVVTESALSAQPREHLLYYPYPAPQPQAPQADFAEAEGFEFAQSQPDKALEWYRRLAESRSAATRAGALLREARVLRNLGRNDESRAVYLRLAGIPGVRVAGVAAELVGRDAASELSNERAQAEALRQDLLRGRWHLTRGQFEFYWGEATRLAGREEPPPVDGVALAEAAAQVWDERKRDPGPRGQQTLWAAGHPFLVIWRGGPERRAVLVARPESFLKQAGGGDEFLCAAVDAEGRTIAGRKAAGHAAIRTAADWTLSVTAAQPVTEAGVLARQRFLLLGIAVMVSFLILGTYFIARAIRRESEVSRMQSDFVSAVSHEFRSPLTSIRQLSEILALGRVPSEDRRQVYYETLVRETGRLQRLVEALLNFGRMEAGKKLYRFEALDASAIVRRVVSEFEPQVAGEGRHIELREAPLPCKIEADSEAICVALRNLVDNALKYSPGRPTVWVEWGLLRHFVAIRVRDEGHGVAASERKAIFRKFVRGSAAADGNVKGSGVGLAMVNDIVAAHGGEITVDSEPGRGSTFTMLLPSAEEMR